MAIDIDRDVEIEIKQVQSDGQDGANDERLQRFLNVCLNRGSCQTSDDNHLVCSFSGLCFLLDLMAISSMRLSPGLLFSAWAR